MSAGSPKFFPLSNNHRNYLRICTWRRNFQSLPMSTSKERNVGFPWFEDKNFTDWFVQFKAHLRC